jgi:hypothetical protein
MSIVKPQLSWGGLGWPPAHSHEMKSERPCSLQPYVFWGQLGMHVPTHMGPHGCESYGIPITTWSRNLAVGDLHADRPPPWLLLITHQGCKKGCNSRMNLVYELLVVRFTFDLL